MVGHEPDVTLDPSGLSFDAAMFEAAPVSLWLEDYAGLRQLFEQWRAAGVTSLRDHLSADPARIKACTSRLRVLTVNRKTLDLFDAKDVPDLVGNLDRVFRDDMLLSHIDELESLWDGRTTFCSNTVNYTLAGRRLDIQLSGRILPGHEQSWSRVLVAIEDVTERETARAGVALAESYAKGLFEHSPVSLWVEDFRGVKRLLDELRRRGIEDLRVFTDVHPEFILQCMSEIHVLDVNRHTLQMFAAPDKQTLLSRLSDVFRDGMQQHFREQLIDLWQGKLFQQREVVNYTLDGGELHVHLQFSVLPGHEEDWSLVQVALTDITARKRAEAYLEFLGKHDVLTKIYNRSFYNDELNRLDRKNTRPVSIIIADLNGLKTANDQLGHAAGDSLLSRAGEVLQKAVRQPWHVARIGGDEFAVIMPGGDEQDAGAMIEAINQLVDLNNQFHSDLTLSMSLGSGTSRPGDRMETIVKRADDEMYMAKRRYYARNPHDRRRAS